MSTLTVLAAWFQAQYAEARSRAAAESERGDVVEKVVIVAGFAVLAALAIAFITALVQGKLNGISL